MTAVPSVAVGATLSGSGLSAIVWVEGGASCATALEERYPERRILALAVTSRGTHA